MVWLDAYDRKARAAPGFFALLAVAVDVTSLGLRHSAVVSLLISAASIVGGPVLLASVVRYLGNRAQDILWPRWGGPPTTRNLRLAESTSNRIQRDAWRAAIERVTGAQLLTLRAERADPTRADEAIDYAVGRLRSLCRAEPKRFPLVVAENSNYGFERNMLGLRWSGRCVSGVCLLVLAGAIVSAGHTVPAEYIIGAAIDAMLLALWVVAPSEKRTKLTAEKYAFELLQAGITIADSPAAPNAQQPQVDT